MSLQLKIMKKYEILNKDELNYHALDDKKRL